MYLKILVNHLQIIALINILEFNWPDYFLEYFKVNKKMVIADEVVSIECVLQDYNIQEKKLHVNTYIILLFPFSILFTIAIFLIILRVITKKPQINRFFISFIVTSTFLQPTVLQTLFDNLKYINLDNVNYLTKDLISIYDEEHEKYVFLIRNNKIYLFFNRLIS